MKRLWQRWVALIDRRGPGDALALMRVLTGLAALQLVASLLVFDMVQMLYLGPEQGGFLAPYDPGWLVQLLGGPTPRVVWTLVGAAAVGAVCTTVGLGGRVAPLVTAQAFIALRTINPYQGAYAAVIGNALWILVLADATATLSVDCRLRSGRWVSDAPIPLWPRYVAIAQLAVIYTSNGLHKLSVHWVPGGDLSAIYYILIDPMWSRGDMRWVAHVYPATQVGTLVTWLFELTWGPAIVLILYYRRTRDRAGWLRRRLNRYDLRKVYLGFAALWHTLVFATLDVGPFLLGMLAYYPCLFHADELRPRRRQRRIAHALDRRARRWTYLEPTPQ